MNINTGEIAEYNKAIEDVIKDADPEDEVPKGLFPKADAMGPVKKKDIVEIGVGDIGEFMGVPCKIVHINSGKNRISLSPIGKLKLRDSNPKKLAPPPEVHDTEYHGDSK